MSTGRALTLFLAIAGVALIAGGLLMWRARHPFRVSPLSTLAADSGEAVPSAGGAHKTALHFFRNPAVVPSFAVTDLDGRQVSPAWGKVTIVNFWATWCSPCRAEIPDLIALQEKYRDRLQIIGVSEDEAPAEEVRQFVLAHKMNYPVVMTTKELQQLFPGVYALPTSFVLDRESRLVQKHVGMLAADTTELEARALAGLTVDASIEQVDQAQGLKLDNGAQLMDIPGVDLTALTPQKRADALQKLNAQSCTCGCDLTVAKCRVDDPTCGISLPAARQIVKQIAGQP